MSAIRASERFVQGMKGFQVNCQVALVFLCPAMYYGNLET